MVLTDSAPYAYLECDDDSDDEGEVGCAVGSDGMVDSIVHTHAEPMASLSTTTMSTPAAGKRDLTTPEYMHTRTSHCA